MAAIMPTISAADQPRPGGRGDPVEIAEADPGLVERLRDQPLEMIEMGARGDLRHDAAIGRVLGELRQHQIGADERRRPSLTTAAAVSSQLVSMPRMFMVEI